MFGGYGLVVDFACTCSPVWLKITYDRFTKLIQLNFLKMDMYESAIDLCYLFMFALDLHYVFCVVTLSGWSYLLIALGLLYLLVTLIMIGRAIQ